jgi:hypothetical protein
MSDRAQGPACEWHEERISRNEDSLSDVAVQMAGMSEQLKHMVEKVGEVGTRLGGDIDRFREANEAGQKKLMVEVEALKVANAEQDVKLGTLLADRETRVARIEALKKGAVWVVVALLGAVATKWGEALYEWFAKSKG